LDRRSAFRAQGSCASSQTQPLLQLCPVLASQHHAARRWPTTSECQAEIARVRRPQAHGTRLSHRFLNTSGSVVRGLLQNLRSASTSDSHERRPGAADALLAGAHHPNQINVMRQRRSLRACGEGLRRCCGKGLWQWAWRSEADKGGERPPDGTGVALEGGMAQPGSLPDPRSLG